MSRLAALSVHQLRYEQLAFWRNPPAAVFTFAFPVMFLVVFASLNTGSRIEFLDGLPFNQYYVPSIAAFGLISACFTNLAMTLALRRDAGTLKRLRATPLPAAALLGGLLLNALVVAVVLLVVLLAVGVGFYDVEVPGQWVALLLAVVVGVACFCSLGVAMSTLVRNADAAPAVVNGVLLPVALVSGVFFPLPPDSVLSRIADFAPVRPLAQALFAAFDPRTPNGLGAGIDWASLGVLVAWGVLGAVVAVRRFRWTPSRR